jgi:hypothetical protein
MYWRPDLLVPDVEDSNPGSCTGTVEESGLGRSPQPREIPAHVLSARSLTQATQQMSAIEQARTPSAHNGTGIRFAPPGQNPDHR